MEPITEEEALLIKQLRDNVSDLRLTGHFDTDCFYLRWIRARELNPDKAEEMLRKSILWRKENDIDSVRKWEPNASVPVDLPLEVSGCDRAGCPVVLVPFYSWDIRKGVESGMAQELIRYIDHVFEVVEHIMREKSTPEKPVTQLDLVFDMNNLSFWQLCSMKTIETILEVVRRYEANHPEILHRAYIINASRMFYMLFNIVKPFLHHRTLAKVVIFGTQRRDWIAGLLKDIQQDQLPTYFGGDLRTSLTMYQENGNSFRNRFQAPSPQLKCNTININPEEKVLLTFDVTVPNSKLAYEFRTDYYDIEFGLYKENMVKDPEVKYDRYPSHIAKIQGEITCKTAGQYIAEFNNTFSEIRRAKTLHYYFKVIHPNSGK